MTPRERLIRLAEVMEARPAKDDYFDLSIYALLRGCNTVACALGWGALDPVLQAEGLTLLSQQGDDDFPIHDLSDPHAQAGTAYPDVDFCRFFGIEGEDITYLFTNRGYPEGQRGPHDVAKKLRKYAAL